MNQCFAKVCRSASQYLPGITLVEYEKPELQRVGRMPSFRTHARVIRELGPVIPGAEPNCKPNGRVISGQRRRVVERTVEKIIIGADGRTPRFPIMALTKNALGIWEHIAQTTLFPVSKPIRLKKGSPRYVYQELKKLERQVGLSVVHAALREVE